MEHAIEHAVGIYITLIGIACLVGILAKWLTHLPYTIALVLVGLVLAVVPTGLEIEETGFSKSLIFFVLLPPLLFQGALHMQLAQLRRHALPIALFATIGVTANMLIIGGVMFGTGVFETLLIAMLFGAIICPTDPVSVLAMFRRYNVPTDLKYLVEGESLFNDGTGVVLFTIVLSLLAPGAEFSLLGTVGSFFRVSIGGAAIGIAIGYGTYLVLSRLTDHLLENMICLVACYASFWVAEHFHLSGVIATVTVGLLLGNYGRELAMKPKTIETVETFFESIDFLINSLLFILIGLELQAIHLEEITGHLGGLAIAIVAMLGARMLVTYPLFFATRPFTDDHPKRWSHLLFWGGLRGSIPIALLLGLETDIPQRNLILVLGFGVVCFSLIGQGLTMKPLILAQNLHPDKDKPDPAHHQEGLD